MKIAAVLCWFQEPVEFLDRCVRSLQGVADHLVAVDGRFELYPVPDDTSGVAEYDAIEAAAASAGIALTFLHKGPSTQVEKRAFAYSSAVLWAEPDWLFVIDGDEAVTHVDPAFRTLLAETDRDVGRVHCARINGVVRPMVTERHVRRVFRGIPGLTVKQAHNGVVTPDGRWLAGQRHLIKPEPPVELGKHLRITHYHSARPQDRNARRRVYYRERSRQRVEVHG